ncbi:MAG: hypothetical protein LC659_05205, partial [Myxococcales bacterium]|nr:hypothetical protein [Myxococcales bacterium]
HRYLFADAAWAEIFWSEAASVYVRRDRHPELVPLGLERTSLTPGVSPGFRLDFIDWSHSFAMSLVWALVFAAMFFKRGGAVALFCGIAVFSHFVLDLLMHPHDLALWPHSTTHLGLGIWTIHPPFWWFFELAFIAACLAYYVARAKKLQTFGGRAWAVVAVVALLHVVNSPWLSPTR